jgi:hypothetical protein
MANLGSASSHSFKRSIFKAPKYSLGLIGTGTSFVGGYKCYDFISGEDKPLSLLALYN